MKYSEASIGRIFIIRLEDGDILHESIEQFSRDKNIKSASVIFLGGVDKESTLIVGPQDGRAETIKPMEYLIDNVHEAAGVGTIFPDSKGEPVLHMHAVCGRKGKSRTGCVREGVKIWHIGEVILIELNDNQAVRKKDESTGFELLAL